MHRFLSKKKNETNTNKLKHYQNAYAEFTAIKQSTTYPINGRSFVTTDANFYKAAHDSLLEKWH